MFPVDKFAKISYEQIDDTRLQKARYYRNRSRGNKDSYFMLSLTTPPLPYAEYRALLGEIMGYEGALEIFQLNNPLPELNSISGDLTDSSAIKGAKQITIDSSNDYRVGEFVQFAGHSKVYLISGVTGASTKTLSLSCPLSQTVSTGAAVSYGSNVVFQLCLDDTATADIDAKKGKLGVINVDLIEQA